MFFTPSDLAQERHFEQKQHDAEFRKNHPELYGAAAADRFESILAQHAAVPRIAAKLEAQDLKQAPRRFAAEPVRITALGDLA